MRRTLFGISILVLTTLAVSPLLGQHQVARAYSDRVGQTHVVDSQRKDHVVAREAGQVGIDSIQKSQDGKTVGWLVLYKDPGGRRVSGTLAVWQGGKVVRRFRTDQTFWSWAFDDTQGKRVAYHVGATHGESTSRCELHDVKTGQLALSWQGDLQDATRPPWTQGLTH